MTHRELNKEEQRVIIHKGTEAPFTGEYNMHKEYGTYHCKQCDSPLYLSDDKFESGCGWPSFDDEIPGAVERLPDADGRRTEIICSNCKGHLGHVFLGESFTNKNTRHCVNSISMIFKPSGSQNIAVFAAGCFWGVEFYFQKLQGVISVESGYTGGKLQNPSYEEVCSGDTGHAEAVKITFDPDVIIYESLVKYFFEIHDFEQLNRQGPDIGTQYRSAIFFANANQEFIAEKLITELNSRSYKVATTLEKLDVFWKAEKHHQNYYNKTGSMPYCHSYKKIF